MSDCRVTVPQGGGSQVTTGGGGMCCMACSAVQTETMQRYASTVTDRDYEYIPVTWGIKIAEFLVEMELFPHFPQKQ